MPWNHQSSHTAECLSRPSNERELAVGARRASASMTPRTFLTSASRCRSRKPARASRSFAVENFADTVRIVLQELPRRPRNVPSLQRHGRPRRRFSRAGSPATAAGCSYSVSAIERGK